MSVGVADDADDVDVDVDVEVDVDGGFGVVGLTFVM